MVCVLVHRHNENKFVFGADDFWSVFLNRYDLHVMGVKVFFTRTLEDRLGFNGVLVGGHEIYFNNGL